MLDDEMEPGLSLEAWVSGVQEGYPDAVVSIVYDRPQPGAERAWADRLDLVVAALDGSGGRSPVTPHPTSVPRTRD